VIDIRRQWLSVTPWEKVARVNTEQCRAQNVSCEQRPDRLEQARRVWQEAYPRLLSLQEALDVCRQCCELAPFVFNNGNTFGAISHLLIEDCLRPLSPLERQIVLSTVSHYVNGIARRGELRKVLRHFGPKCVVPDAARPPAGVKPSAPAPTPDSPPAPKGSLTVPSK